MKTTMKLYSLYYQPQARTKRVLLRGTAKEFEKLDGYCKQIEHDVAFVDSIDLEEKFLNFVATQTKLEKLDVVFCDKDIDPRF